MRPNFTVLTPFDKLIGAGGVFDQKVTQGFSVARLDCGLLLVGPTSSAAD